MANSSTRSADARTAVTAAENGGASRGGFDSAVIFEASRRPVRAGPRHSPRRMRSYSACVPIQNQTGPSSPSAASAR
jgi:hypothetical protein